MVDKKHLMKVRAESAFIRIDNALNDAYDLICELVKENGGFIKTIPTSDKPILRATYRFAFTDKDESEIIYGLHYNEENGLCLCTSSMLENYSFEEEYYFTSDFDFNGEDLMHLDNILERPEYFVEFDKYNLQRTPTILSIIGGLSNYID